MSQYQFRRNHSADPQDALAKQLKTMKRQEG